jgi:CheY-like chemotaxis protein
MNCYNEEWNYISPSLRLGSVKLGIESTQMARVLVVEDEARIRLLVTTILKKGGFAVVEAQDGTEALDLLLHDPLIDLIISDLAMPDKDGAWLLREVRQRFPQLPFIIMTAYDASEWAQPIIKEANDCLKKPFAHHELLEMVRKFLK